MSTDSLFSTFQGSDTLYITIGNRLRGDDGAGPVIASRLSKITEILIKDAGDRPERSMNWVLEIRPSLVVFIDASDFGGLAGEIRELPLESISDTTFSTHRIPLPLIAGWITSETGAECRCIGIQPASMSLGESLSPEVELAAAEIVRKLRSIHDTGKVHGVGRNYKQKKQRGVSCGRMVGRNSETGSGGMPANKK